MEENTKPPPLIRWTFLLVCITTYSSQFRSSSFLFSFFFFFYFRTNTTYKEYNRRVDDRNMLEEEEKPFSLGVIFHLFLPVCCPSCLIVCLFVLFAELCLNELYLCFILTNVQCEFWPWPMHFPNPNAALIKICWPALPLWARVVGHKAGRAEGTAEAKEYVDRREERAQKRTDRQTIKSVGQPTASPPARQGCLIYSGVMKKGKASFLTSCCSLPPLSPFFPPPPLHFHTFTHFSFLLFFSLVFVSRSLSTLIPHSHTLTLTFTFRFFLFHFTSLPASGIPDIRLHLQFDIPFLISIDSSSSILL
jgi:hypothetical protein